VCVCACELSEYETMQWAKASLGTVMESHV
jgi:hypothetical protein